MSRVVSWWQAYERKMFFFINLRMQHKVLDGIMNRITHLGGATFTISFSLLLIMIGNSAWRMTGWQCLLALTLSHIPVAIMKRVYPRLRPYLVLPESNRCERPLTDHSFPSGHTTAMFSMVLPIAFFMPVLSFLILPLALIVGISRIYLGLHYPSDVAAGMIIAYIASVVSVSLLTPSI